LSDEIDPSELEPSETISFPLRGGVKTEKHQKLSVLPLDPLTLGAPSSPGFLPPNDAIDKYAHCVASELRLIRQPQQLVLAKWHIQNVLFQAQFGMLAGPPATLAFGSTPTNFPPDALVNWPQTPLMQTNSSEGDSEKDSSL
jgi:hypothetical protein